MLGVFGIWWEIGNGGHPALAVTLVVSCLALEMILSGVSRYKTHRFTSTLNNFSVGILVGTLTIVFPIANFLLYVQIFDRWRLIEVPADSLWAPIVALLAFDFTHYWAHRAAHRINLIWAAHIVHHQSEDFNLSVGARIAVHGFFDFWCHLPLALFGISPALYFVAQAVFQVWQFTTHAAIRRSFGPIERILITPATHSVHHACNTEYLDKNYGGVFSIWDQLFGTYAAFDAKIEARFGTVRGMQSWNPVMAIAAPWIELVKLSVRSRSLSELARIWFGNPNHWNEVHAREQKRAPRVARSASWNLYALFQSIPLLLAAAVLGVYLRASSSIAVQATSWAFIAVSMCCVGAVLDGARWARVLEPARLLALSLLPASIMLVPEFSARFLHFPWLATPSNVWSAIVLSTAFGLSSIVWFRHLHAEPHRDEALPRIAFAQTE